MALTEKISLARLLQIRPAVVGLLNASGLPFWGQLEATVEVFCARSGLDPKEWIHRVNELPVPPETSDWNVEPLYGIADYLTAEHREFMEKDLLGIRSLLETRGVFAHSDIQWLHEVYQAFKPFESSFLIHMLDEEERIFPHILRLEALACDPDSPSLLGEVALEAFADEEINASERHLRKTVSRIHKKIHDHRIEEPTATIENRLCMELAGFEKRLSRHNDIETGFLFPRALKMEKQFARSLNHSSAGSDR